MLYTVIDPKNPSEVKEIIDAPDYSHDISLITEYNCNVLSLINGKLYIWNYEDKKWISLKSNLANKNIITLKSRFGCLFAISENGEIYFKENKNEEKDLEKDEFKFDELKLTVKQREPCPHGIKFDDQSILGVSDIDCSISAIFIIDSEKNLWTYSRDKPSIDKNGYIQVTQINFKRKIWNIFCGRSHCIALCEASDSALLSASILDDSEISLLSPDTSLITGPVTSTPRRNSINPKCEDCQAESNCRLSLLMKLADESAATSSTTTTPTTTTTERNGIHSPSDTPTSSTTPATASGDGGDKSGKDLPETPKMHSTGSIMRSKLKLEKLRFPFRNSKQKSPKKDLKSRTVWHTASLPLGSSLGSFGSPRRRHESEDGGGVEMSTIGSSSTLPRQAPPSTTITDLTGSAIFSYVNLDNFIEIGESSLSTTPDSRSQRPSISTTSNPSVTTSSVESSPAKKQPQKGECHSTKAVEKFELWSWGSNAQGQLGHGDTIARREPKMIRGVSGLIQKVCVGDNHNIALMASGEAYVWGSNSNGQLKQMNQSFIESPTLWRLGAESTIIDVEVGPNSTAAIVAGQSSKSNASIYHFGREEENDTETSSTSVLNGVLKIGSPFGFFSISKEFGILIGVLPDKNEEENVSTKENYSKLLTVTEAVKLALQLSSLAPKLVHSNKDSESKTLLLNLSEKVKAWSQLLSRLSSNCLKTFSKFGNLNIITGEKSNCQFKDLCKTLLELHFAFIEAVSFRCFSDIKLDNDLLFQIDKLCLENNTESSQQQKRLKYLFELPFQHFKRLRNIASTTEKLPPNFWKHFDRTLERNEGYARNTYNVAKELQQFNADSARPSSISFYLPHGSSIQSLVKPSRLVIWSSHDPTSLSNPIIKVKETGPTAAPTTTWRRFMSANFTTIVVFSDSIALIQKGDYIIIEMPLVWMNSVSSMNNEIMDIDPALITEETSELMVQIVAPEYEFHVEFPNVEMKNHLLSAFSASFRLHRERTELTVFDDQLGTSIHVLPQTRYGTYDYSSTHYMYKNCRYEGFWKSGIPHGIGTITYFDGREYKGRFINGNIHGFGEMKIPEEQKEPSPLMSSVFFTEFPAKKTNKYHHYKGKWKNGKLHGLSFIQYANGDTYEGYCIAGLPSGHGVYRSMDYNGGQQVYVGGWLSGLKNGYGVLSLNKERYLGMWKDDMRHDKGCQITIDGVFHEGIFDRNRFTKGRIVYQTNENEMPASYEGEFEKIGIAAGKGILRLTPADQIEGTINGVILSGELKITNATYTRKDIRPAFHISMADLQIVDEGPIQSQWAVTADLKWQELFDQFLLDELGFGETGKSNEELCKRAWERLSSGVEKIKVQKNIQIDERLERVPNVYDEWTPAYYATVCEYWNLCLSTPHHPINRLINGLVEIFCCSYNNIGTHAIMYDSAVLEFTSLIQRAYRVMRYLFPHLPSVSTMYQAIPSYPNSSSTNQTQQNLQEDATSVSSLEEKDNLSVKSTSSKPSSGQGSVGPSADDFTIATPCCDFIIHHFFGQCYAELFTMYSVKCNEMDRRYWERVMFLNTATDARLLSYLGVEKGLWPMDTENTSDLDKFMVRVTARKKFYETAIHTLQRLSCEFNPSSKLSILAETFSEISACVSQFSSIGRAHIWSGDDLLPAFMYVVIRSQLQHLGAEIRLISDFCPQLSGSGQIDLMFTMLCASYVQICNEKSLP